MPTASCAILTSPTMCVIGASVSLSSTIRDVVRCSA
jgi:hypothetical protein